MNAKNVPFFVILKSIEVFLFSTKSLWSRLLVFSALKSHLRLAVQDFQLNPCVEIKEAQRMKYHLINYQLGKKRVHMLSGVSLEDQESSPDLILEELLCSEGLLWLPSSQIASSAFTLGTVAVLPFYTFMVAAPEAKLTKKIIASSIPYIVLGLLYAYLLYLSWTPDTIQLMFASKYWLPQLTGIAKMFSNEMTLASAWIHLLAVDLFAARQVYHDGLKNNVEMRHSVSLCLLFCPLGILVHFITRAFTASRKRREHGDTSR